MTASGTDIVALVVDDERDRRSLDEVLVSAGLFVTACDRFAASEVLRDPRTTHAVIDLIDEVDRDGIDFRGDRSLEGVSVRSLLATASRSGLDVIAVVRPESIGASDSIRRAGATEVVAWMGAGPTGATIARLIAGAQQPKPSSGGDSE